MAKELAEVLRDAIRKGGWSAYALNKETGVPQERISAFLRGTNLHLRSAHKLADFLGLALQPKSKKGIRCKISK